MVLSKFRSLTESDEAEVSFLFVENCPKAQHIPTLSTQA